MLPDLGPAKPAWPQQPSDQDFFLPFVLLLVVPFFFVVFFFVLAPFVLAFAVLAFFLASEEPGVSAAAAEAARSAALRTVSRARLVSFSSMDRLRVICWVISLAMRSAVVRAICSMVWAERWVPAVRRAELLEESEGFAAAPMRAAVLFAGVLEAAVVESLFLAVAVADVFLADDLVAGVFFAAVLAVVFRAGDLLADVFRAAVFRAVVFRAGAFAVDDPAVESDEVVESFDEAFDGLLDGVIDDVAEAFFGVGAVVLAGLSVVSTVFASRRVSGGEGFAIPHCSQTAPVAPMTRP